LSSTEAAKHTVAGAVDIDRHDEVVLLSFGSEEVFEFVEDFSSHGGNVKTLLVLEMMGYETQCGPCCSFRRVMISWIVSGKVPKLRVWCCYGERKKEA